MILKRIKENSVNKILNRESKKIQEPDLDNGKIRTVAFIVNYDETSNLGDFYKLTRAIGVQDADVNIIGYLSRKEKDQQYPIPMFSEKSFGWNGKVKDQTVETFLNSTYDLLINYYRRPNLTLNLLSSRTKAGFRVGLGTENEKLNHLLLEIEDNSFLSFMEETLKYLTILKRI